MTNTNSKRTGYGGIAIAAILGLIGGCASGSRPVTQEAIFYPPPPDTPRIQFLTSITSEEDIGTRRDRFREFVTGEKDRMMRIARPWDIDHTKGRLYVSDKIFRRIVIVDLENKRIRFVDDSMSGALDNPGGIFVDSAGYKYIADRGRRAVLAFDNNDAFFRSYEIDDQFEPTDVVVSGQRIYATDVNSESIRIFDRVSGEVTGTIGKQGEGRGTFRFPTHLTLDDDGNLFVTDFLNFSVQMFDATGKYVRTIGEPGDFPGAMPRPKGIDVDRLGNLYAVDSAFEIVQIFDVASGNALMPFGKFGSLSGGTWLPAGVHIDYDNLAYFAEYVEPGFQPQYLIYVTNQAGPFKINVFAFGEYRGGNSAARASAAD